KPEPSHAYNKTLTHNPTLAKALLPTLTSPHPLPNRLLIKPTPKRPNTKALLPPNLPNENLHPDSTLCPRSRSVADQQVDPPNVGLSSTDSPGWHTPSRDGFFDSDYRKETNSISHITRQDNSRAQILNVDDSGDPTTSATITRKRNRPPLSPDTASGEPDRPYKIACGAAAFLVLIEVIVNAMMCY
ncbi:hypothetical protein GIB67_012800, partial [Kingdonia uniflora]